MTRGSTSSGNSFRNVDAPQSWAIGRFEVVPKNILGEAKGFRSVFGVLSPELHGCCLAERARSAKWRWDPPEFRVGGRGRTKKIPIKGNSKCSDGEKLPSGSCCAPARKGSEPGGEARWPWQGSRSLPHTPAVSGVITQFWVNSGSCILRTRMQREV